jgi:hypothetical protein
MSTVFVPVFCMCGYEDDVDSDDLAQGLRLQCPRCGRLILLESDDD